MKRLLVEQSLEAGRLYLQEEGEDKRLSSDSVDSGDLGKHLQSCFPSFLHCNYVVFERVEFNDKIIFTFAFLRWSVLDQLAQQWWV